MKAPLILKVPFSDSKDAIIPETNKTNDENIRFQSVPNNPTPNTESYRKESEYKANRPEKPKYDNGDILDFSTKVNDWNRKYLEKNEEETRLKKPFSCKRNGIEFLRK